MVPVHHNPPLRNGDLRESTDMAELYRYPIALQKRYFRIGGLVVDPGYAACGSAGGASSGKVACLWMNSYTRGHTL